VDNAVDLLGLAVAELGLDGRLRTLSARMARLLELPGAGAGFDLHVLHWQFPDGEPVLPRILAGADVVEMTTLTLPSGTVLHPRLNAVPRLVDGRTAAVVICLTDLTRETAAALKATAQAQMYKTIADHMADVVLVMEDEVIGWVSPSAQEVLGYRPEDLLGRPAPTLIHPDDMHDLVVTRESPTMTGRTGWSRRTARTPGWSSG
jgi:PAS domain-containing protein